MKKMLMIALASFTLGGCISNQQNEIAQPRGEGYTVTETENVKLVKQLNEASVKYDTAAMRSFYSGAADTIHNNLENMTLEQNLQMMGGMQKDGITATITSYPAIWETINDKPNAKGQTNFVVAYIFMDLSRGTKTTRVVLNQICAIKDGKVVEEWDVYDTKPFSDLMK